jgi:hypothetical protein
VIASLSYQCRFKETILAGRRRKVGVRVRVPQPLIFLLAQILSKLVTQCSYQAQNQLHRVGKIRNWEGYVVLDQKSGS